ncbi:MAG: succinate dehydrogenase / fumarate reductase, cytochrome b subunit [Verrucomicrobiota bacterium]|jgi:succinate dehydrogenase / fumarate reductase cytochrome b subunit
MPNFLFARSFRYKPSRFEVRLPRELDTQRPNSNFSYPAAERLEPAKPVTALSSFYRSSVGKKMIVAVTGVVLIAFVVGHLLGNLQIFLGPDWVNSYAEHLRALGPLLWVIRIFLLVNVLVHIFFTINLAIENRRARPVRYKKKDHVKATFASRSMALSGLILLAFILYHLAHFTVRVTDPRFLLLKADPLNRYDVYSMMVYGFQNPYVSGFYILGMFLLALHLSHGTSSFFQSLGVNDEKLAPRLATAGRIFAWLIFVGYTSIPAAVLLHLVKPAQQL